MFSMSIRHFNRSEVLTSQRSNIHARGSSAVVECSPTDLGINPGFKHGPRHIFVPFPYVSVLSWVTNLSPLVQWLI